MPEGVRKVFEEELAKLQGLEPSASEANVTREFRSQQRTLFTQMAVPNGHAVHPPPNEKRPLILTLGQIRVRFFMRFFKENQC